MNYSDFMSYLLRDGLYVGVFCQRYKAKLIDVFPNTEDSPPQGLIYEFDNQLGGFSIEGIKNSLKSSLEDKISEGD